MTESRVLSAVIAPGKGQQRKGLLSGFVRFVKSHPILFLLLVSPGIAEYLTSASSLTSLIVLNPLGYRSLATNIGLYGSGVLLIREAMVRWRKGWASVFLLGVAYGILEEGIDVWTLFYSNAAPVGKLGFYGHWLGVNWVWTIGLLTFHSVYSIGLPIFLFGLVFPELKSKSLLARKGLAVAFASLVLDSIFLYGFVSGFYSPYSPGAGLILFSALVIAILVVCARRLPGDFLKRRMGQPSWGILKFAFVGTLLFPATLLVGGIAAGTSLPPMVPFVLELFLALLLLTRTYKAFGTVSNQEQKVTFCIGLLLPIVVFGMIGGLEGGNALIVIGDILFLVFSRRLWGKWHHWTILQRHGAQTGLSGLGGPSHPVLPG